MAAKIEIAALKTPAERASILGSGQIGQRPMSLQLLVALAHLAQQSVVYSTHAFGATTERTNRSAWRKYTDWYHTQDFDPFNGAAGLLQLYLTWLVETGHTISGTLWGHYQRADLITAAAVAEAELPRVIRQARHAASATTMRYYRPSDVWRNKVKALPLSRKIKRSA